MPISHLLLPLKMSSLSVFMCILIHILDFIKVLIAYKLHLQTGVNTTRRYDLTSELDAVIFEFKAVESGKAGKAMALSVFH